MSTPDNLSWCIVEYPGNSPEERYHVIMTQNNAIIFLGGGPSKDLALAAAVQTLGNMKSKVNSEKSYGPQDTH